MKDERIARMNETFSSRVPHNKWLGMTALNIEDGKVSFRVPYRPRLVGNPQTGALHGGVVTAIMDASAGASVFTALRVPRRIATLDLRIDYLRASQPEKDVFSEATCYRVTKQVAFTRGIAHHGDPSEPIASCAGTFMIFGEVPSTIMQADPPPGDPGTRIPSEPPRAIPPTDDSFVERVSGARSSEELAKAVKSVPYMAAMGMDMRYERGDTLGVMAFGEQLIGNFTVRALHGGTVGALLESTAAFKLVSEREADSIPRIVNITVSYLRGAKDRETYARASITKLGRRVAAVQSRAWQTDPSEPVASALTHFLLG